MPQPGNPTRTEAWALLELAREMHQTKNGPVEEFRAALRRNWRLWTIFQASLIEPDCQVPDHIRRNLLGLANFIDRQTADLLVTPDPVRIDALVNINRQISEGLLEGLRNNAARAPAPAPSATPMSLRQSA
jgi:flagellar protein FlaF